MSDICTRENSILLRLCFREISQSLRRNDEFSNAADSEPSRNAVLELLCIFNISARNDLSKDTVYSAILLQAVLEIAPIIAVEIERHLNFHFSITPHRWNSKMKYRPGSTFDQGHDQMANLKIGCTAAVLPRTKRRENLDDCSGRRNR